MPDSSAPVRIAFAGLRHGHSTWWFRRPQRGDVALVGVWEPDRAVVQEFVERHGLDPAIVYDDLDAMLSAVNPAGVMAFGPIYDHLEVTRRCAPRGVHVMVEKPLAVSGEHAREMAALARQHGIQLLTNYETTWYASNHEAYRRVCEDRSIGAIRKVVVHDGHWGPKEIGCQTYFLNWLTDPVLNGGGAVIDFGCYGANLMTWLMHGAAPLTVTAVLQQMKPDVYPRVDDDATIVLTYPNAQAVVHGSWNWPWHRKDMEIYGATGSIIAADRVTLRTRDALNAGEQTHTLAPRAAPHDDVFAFFGAVLRGEVVVGDQDLSSLANNLTVMRILDAARASARSGMTIVLSDAAPA
jgi:predicted dehydrogenase